VDGPFDVETVRLPKRFDKTRADSVEPDLQAFLSGLREQTKTVLRSYARSCVVSDAAKVFSLSPQINELVELIVAMVSV
jgi:hypothetical protein